LIPGVTQGEDGDGAEPCELLEVFEEPPPLLWVALVVLLVNNVQS